MGTARPEDGGRPDEPGRLDVRIDTPGREGLAGTTPMSVYAPLAREIITIPPDGRPHDEQPAWRRDFPIDWPEDHYIARRDFVKFTTLTSLAFAVGQIWICLQSWWRRRRGPPVPTKIADLAAVEAGQVVTFSYPRPEDTALLVRTKDGKLVAYGQECTHLTCAVVPKPELGRIHCPCHEGWFDLESGRPIAGPPQRPLDRVVVEVRGDEVWATGIERRTV